MELKLFTQIPGTKTEQASFADNMVTNITDGNINPIEAVVKAKAISEAVTAFLKDKRVIDAVNTEVSKYGKGEDVAAPFGAKVVVKEAGTKYDFSQCGDSTLDALYTQMEQLKAQIKARETMLIHIPKDGMADPETGEMVYPPSKSSSTTYSITFKK